MKNQNQKTNENYDLEELFCDTYDTDDFETAVSVFNNELNGESESESEGEEAVFDGDDEGFDGWLKTHKGQDDLLCWLWDVDCGPSGPDGFCREVRDRFGEVSLKTVRFHADDLRFLLDENWG